MSSRVPGAIAQVVSSAGLISAGNAAVRPVILGVGDIKALVTDEKVTRGASAGGEDVLATTLYDVNSVIKIGNSPGSTDWAVTTNYTVDTVNNAISWSPGSIYAASATPITAYVTTTSTSGPTNFTTTSTGLSTVTGFYTGASALITAVLDTSNYGTSSTVTNYVPSVVNGVTTSATFTVSPAFAATIQNGDTVLITLTPSEPGPSQEYYVTYYKKLSNFALTEYFSEADVVSDHGDNLMVDGVTHNKVTIGARLALRNGASSVIVGQLDSTAWGNRYTPTEAEFNASLNVTLTSLENWTTTKLYIAPQCFYNATAWPTTGTSSANYVWNHCKKMSDPNNKGERTCVLGQLTGTSIASYIATATAYASSRVILIAPSGAQFSDLPTLSFGNQIIAAAYAGAASAKTLPSQTLTGQTLNGVSITTLYSPAQERQLLGAGVLVLTTSAGIVTIVHDKSTNTATADTEENTSIDIADYLKKTTREQLYAIYKGQPITTSLPGAMGTTLAAIFEREINQTIASYDQSSISVKQDTAEPRLMYVNAKVNILYPLTWINITLQFQL